jgi:hypothetical protein
MSREEDSGLEGCGAWGGTAEGAVLVVGCDERLPSADRVVVVVVVVEDCMGSVSTEPWAEEVGTADETLARSERESLDG